MPRAPLIGLGLLGLLLAAPARAQDPAPTAEGPAERFVAARSALLAEADQLDCTGAAVGFAAQPGRFFLLTRELIAAGRPAELLELVGHGHVVVRAAGLVALAEAHRELAVPALTARLSSATPLTWNPGGCCAEEITEGRLARELLQNAWVLHGGLHPAEPLQAAPAQAPSPEFQAARERLLAQGDTLWISGACVGRGASPGRFYQLAGELARTGSPADLLGLVAHERAVVRLAGLYGLTRSHPELAVPALSARLSSDTPLTWNPGGCCGEESSEGQIARRLLENADALEVGAPPRPLVLAPALR